MLIAYWQQEAKQWSVKLIHSEIYSTIRENYFEQQQVRWRKFILKQGLYPISRGWRERVKSMRGERESICVGVKKGSMQIETIEAFSSSRNFSCQMQILFLPSSCQCARSLSHSLSSGGRTLWSLWWPTNFAPPPTVTFVSKWRKRQNW